VSWEIFQTGPYMIQ